MPNFRSCQFTMVEIEWAW